MIVMITMMMLMLVVVAVVVLKMAVVVVVVLFAEHASFERGQNAGPTTRRFPFPRIVSTSKLLPFLGFSGPLNPKACMDRDVGLGDLCLETFGIPGSGA